MSKSELYDFALLLGERIGFSETLRGIFGGICFGLGFVFFVSGLSIAESKRHLAIRIAGYLAFLSSGGLIYFAASFAY